jgi:hypothetical protein
MTRDQVAPVGANAAARLSTGTLDSVALIAAGMVEEE